MWPFLLDGELVARVDLKADRSADALQVVGAFVEAGHSPARVAEALAGELETMARWLGLAGVTVGNRGDLAGRCELRAGRCLECGGSGAGRESQSRLAGPT